MILSSIFPFKPFTCPGCGDASHEIVCNPCRSSFRRNDELIAPNKEGVRGCFPIFYSFSTTHKILNYWKNHGGHELRKILFTPTPDLKNRLLNTNIDLIVPIPQHEERSMKRGHASAFEVAKFFSRELGIQIEPELLILKPFHTTAIKQAYLSEWERKHSENPFQLNTKKMNMILKNQTQKILIIDDFITSGSTLDKAANALLSSNFNLEIYAASLGWMPKNRAKLN